MKINPYIRFALYDIINYPWKMTRAIFDYELIYIEEGEMEVKQDKYKAIAKKGDIIFLKPGINHSLTKISDKLVQPHVHFDIVEDRFSSNIRLSFKTLQEFNQEDKKLIRKDRLEDVSLDFPIVMSLPNSYAVKEILYQLITEYNLAQEDSALYLKSLLTEMLISIKRGLKEIETLNKEKTPFNQEELRRYIFENINNNITLDEMANFAHLSKFYFISAFKKAFYETPLQYVNSIKADKAAKLISFTNLPINEIANQLSFDSPQAFTRWFKHYYKVSPLEYRKKQ